MEQLSWYAVQVRTGSEYTTADLCRRLIPEEVLRECFVPECERMKRYEGAWHKERVPMFPGYLFLITHQVRELFFALKRIPALTKLLGDGIEFIPLHEEETAFLLGIGGKDHLAEMSEGYIEGDQVIITNGPMKAFTGRIRRIDRHKRIAVIEVGMFGRIVEVKTGLEIVRKTK